MMRLIDTDTTEEQLRVAEDDTPQARSILKHTAASNKLKNFLAHGSRGHTSLGFDIVI
jgi:hypothetical protein